MTTYTLESNLGTRTVDGTLGDAFRAALRMDDQLRHDSGVTITGHPGYSFSCGEGRIGVSSADDDGYVSLINGELVITWERGPATFFDGVGEGLQGS